MNAIAHLHRITRCATCHGEPAPPPTAAITPARHCVCPGGPVWAALGQRDPAGRWHECLALWRQRGNPREAIIFTGDIFYAMPADQWKHFVALAWDSQLTPIAALAPAERV